MFRIMISQIGSHGSVVRALRLISERLPVLIQPVRFCPSGISAPTLFKSSETKPALTGRRGGLPPRGQLLLLLGSIFGWKWNARPVDRTSVLLPISSRFNLAMGWALTWSFYTAPPDFGKCNAFKQGFANKQWLEEFPVTFSISEVSPYGPGYIMAYQSCRYYRVVPAAAKAWWKWCVKFQTTPSIRTCLPEHPLGPVKMHLKPKTSNPQIWV